MSSQIGAPGTGVSRREFLAATGAVGVGSLAGCVTAPDGSFGSEMVAEAGHAFERTFASDGIHRYACPPHEALGMKGAVVVSEGGAAGASPSDRLGDYLTLGFGASIVAAVLGIPYAAGKERKRPPSPSPSGR